jgi:hypothetical protein
MPATRLRIFISSVQAEFVGVRQGLKAFLLGDPFLRRHVAEVFLFEDLPARDQNADRAYLEGVEQCDIYVGLFGYSYGNAGGDGVSPTEHEFDHATAHEKTRFIYVWGSDEKSRDDRMKQLIRKASNQVIRRRVEDLSSLQAEVYASVIDHLDHLGVLRTPPFDATGCQRATLQHLSRKRIDSFLETARRERGFPIKPGAATRAVLTHLNLLEDRHPTNAAILLFAASPQRFHPSAEVKCVHCHGTEYRRPFASQQVYTGDLFSQADQARDFVLSKINRVVGTRSESSVAPAEYELPPDAVAEAIINAIAHRDYDSNAAVEIRLFADRLEVWNPGSLPSTLTVESLRHDHPSVPANPLVADPLYLARYIEKAGSGTQMMIDECREVGLPEPTFEQRRGSFVVTLWRDWVTEDLLNRLGVSDRQRQAIALVKRAGRVTNAEHQQLTGVTRKTAARDLADLVGKGVLERVGEKRGSHYVLARRK